MKKYKDLLIWLITPQDEHEKELFKDVIDDHCELMNKINYLSEKELIDEINNQIKHLGIKV
jgi:uncharacterized protein YjgD (DUF1641 family)